MESPKSMARRGVLALACEEEVLGLEVAVHHAVLVAHLHAAQGEKGA